MREIKFRAWNKGINKMFPAEELGSDELTINPDGRGFVNVSSTSKQNSQYYPHMIPMQYTGLKDKNGAEIYEGDTVEVDTTGMNYQPEIIKGIVKYIDGCFTVEFTKPVYDNVLKWMRERLYVKCFTVNKAIKVIGNIYVNPELLE